MSLRRARGVTLVELLVVVALVGVLAALVLPAVQHAREAARRARCQNNLRQQGVAMALDAERDGTYPVGCTGYFAELSRTPPPPRRFIAWNVELLPLLEERALREAFDSSLPSYDAANKAVAATVLPVFLCPSTGADALVNPSGLWKGAAFTDYGGIYGVEGAGRNREHETSGDNDVANEFKPEQTLRDDSLGVLLYDEPVAPKHVIDGLSKTACIAETLHRRRSECEWVNGNNIFAHEESTPINTDSGLSNDIGSPHPGGASLAFCDGSVRFVVETVEQAVLNALLTKAGDE